MQVFVDSLIYQLRSSGGIARVFSELLPRACEHDPALQVSLLISGKLRTRPPTHPRISMHRTFPIDDVLVPANYWWRTRVGAGLRSSIQSRHLSSEPAIWHSTYYTPPPRRLPSVVTVHDMIYERMPEQFNSPAAASFRMHKRRSIQGASAIIAVSAATRDDLYELFAVPHERIRIVPNGVSSAFRPMFEAEYRPLGNGRPFLLYLGGRAKYKNFWRFLDSYRSWSRSSEVDVVVVGRPWSEGEIRKLARLGVSKRVTLVGNVDDGVLCQLMNAALALVHPSLCEGFGLPVLEAMACGCPVVASRIPAVIEVANDTPFYFEPTSSDDLRSALDRALTAGRSLERIESGVERARRYTWGDAADALLNVYSDLA